MQLSFCSTQILIALQPCKLRALFYNKTIVLDVESVDPPFNCYLARLKLVHKVNTACTPSCSLHIPCKIHCDRLTHTHTHVHMHICTHTCTSTPHSSISQQLTFKLDQYFHLLDSISGDWNTRQTQPTAVMPLFQPTHQLSTADKYITPCFHPST